VIKLIREVGIVLVALFLAGASKIDVVDGDTIRIDGEMIRLQGIDAPEANQICPSKAGGTWSCGRKATEALGQLVRSGEVSCDHNGLDQFGRTLAVCRAGSVEINRTLVQEGLAWAFRRYSLDYSEDEDRAHAELRGIWQTETQPPWDFRSARWKVATQESPNGCPIKGNISKGGDRIYHAPWSPFYTRTRVNTAAGERWFCSEGEAIAAGWRAPLWGRRF
jgi:endonuclease YncB( thermonuclease family)